MPKTMTMDPVPVDSQHPRGGWEVQLLDSAGKVLDSYFSEDEDRTLAHGRAMWRDYDWETRSAPCPI